jgi:hypothetical protein
MDKEEYIKITVEEFEWLHERIEQLERERDAAQRALARYVVSGDRDD